MKPGEVLVKMFDHQLWPRLSDKDGAYDFTAIYHFRDLDSYFRGDPHSRAIQIRNSTKWFGDYIKRVVTDYDTHLKIRRVFNLVHTLSVLLERAPEAECRFPPTPCVE